MPEREEVKEFAYSNTSFKFMKYAYLRKNLLDINGRRFYNQYYFSTNIFKESVENLTDSHF